MCKVAESYSRSSSPNARGGVNKCIRSPHQSLFSLLCKYIFAQEKGRLIYGSITFSKLSKYFVLESTARGTFEFDYLCIFDEQEFYSPEFKSGALVGYSDRVPKRLFSFKYVRISVLHYHPTSHTHVRSLIRMYMTERQHSLIKRTFILGIDMHVHDRKRTFSHEMYVHTT